MANSKWTRSFTFSVSGAPPAALEVGISHILSPIFPIEVGNVGQRVRFLALIDSGADYSYLPYQAARLLGVDPRSLPGSPIQNQGIGGTIESKFVEFDVSILDDATDKVTYETQLPFLVPLKDNAGSDVVLIGRHPFFDEFDVDFRMGFTDDPKLGKWVLREVKGRRDSRRYRR